MRLVGWYSSIRIPGGCFRRDCSRLKFSYMYCLQSSQLVSTSRKFVPVSETFVITRNFANRSREVSDFLRFLSLWADILDIIPRRKQQENVGMRSKPWIPDVNVKRNNIITRMFFKKCLFAGHSSVCKMLKSLFLMCFFKCC